jgi:hypothetical protein
VGPRTRGDHHRAIPELGEPVEALLDSFGPLLGEVPTRPFHPDDDRITTLGLHHHIADNIRHDVIINGWWKHQQDNALTCRDEALRHTVSGHAAFSG